MAMPLQMRHLYDIKMEKAGRGRQGQTVIHFPECAAMTSSMLPRGGSWDVSRLWSGGAFFMDQRHLEFCLHLRDCSPESGSLVHYQWIECHSSSTAKTWATEHHTTWSVPRVLSTVCIHAGTIWCSGEDSNLQRPLSRIRGYSPARPTFSAAATSTWRRVKESNPWLASHPGFRDRLPTIHSAAPSF